MRREGRKTTRAAEQLFLDGIPAGVELLRERLEAGGVRHLTRGPRPGLDGEVVAEGHRHGGTGADRRGRDGRGVGNGGQSGEHGINVGQGRQRRLRAVLARAIHFIIGCYTF